LAVELARARHGDVRGIHRARTSSRRLREVLPVAEAAAPGAGVDRTRREIRRITRALGPVRELDVAIAEFAESAGHYAEPVAASIERHLAEERTRRFHSVVVKLGALDPDRLRARLEAVAAAVDTETVRRVWERALAERLRRRAGRVLRAIDEAGTLYVPERLHAVRIAAKKLRYGLELTRDAAGLPVGSLVASIKRVQDVLGRLHDLEVLAGHVREMAATSRQAAAGADPILLALERECRAQHARYLAKRVGLGTQAVRTKNEVAPTLKGRQLPMMKLGASALSTREARWPDTRSRRSAARNGRTTPSARSRTTAPRRCGVSSPDCASST
jgi:CHAD domain-containing protein